MGIGRTFRFTEITRWLQRRIKFRLADDKPIAGFARGAKDRSLSLDFGNDERLARLIQAGNERKLEEIAKLLGQSDQDLNP